MPSVAQRLAHLVAVHAGQKDVEHDRAVGAFAGSPQTVEPVVAQLDVEPFVVQTFGDGLGEPDVVLDHKHAHGRDSEPSGVEPKATR